MKNHFNILIVDDNPADSNLLRRYIQSIEYWTFNIDIVTNAEQAIKLYKANNHDFIFVDYLLGNTNGLELISFFENAGQKADFILLTGHGNETVAQEAIRAGAIDYLNKNSLTTELVARIIRHHKQRIETEQKISKVEHKISNLLENTDTGLIALTASGKITDVNKTFTAILGFQETSLIVGNKIQNLIPQTDMPKFEQFLNLCKKQKTLKNYNIAFRNQKNQPITISINAIFDDENIQNQTILAICRDITERVNYEKELELAKLKAEESDRLKTSFLSNMSHEIRTPMNAIVGFSDLLADDDADTEMKNQYIELIKESSISLLQLINDIIDISQLETTQFSFNKTNIRVETLLNELKNYAGFEANKQAKHLQLKLNIDANLYLSEIFVDVPRFKQIISNFISNSIKFTEKGFIEIGARNIEQNQIEFYVADSGIGIHEEKQKIIFDRFRKIEDDNSKLYRGAGLGLTIAQRLTQLMGGKINVESRLHKGSKFFVQFFVQQLQKNEKEIVVQTETENSVFFWPDKNILIAEDEKINFKFLEKALKKTHANIDWAKNGNQAIEMVANNKYDVVLMDMKMPGMDGYQATKIIKEKNKNCIIIAQTAYAMSGEKEAIMQAGCDDYLAKPIKRSKLLNTIAKYF